MKEEPSSTPAKGQLERVNLLNSAKEGIELIFGLVAPTGVDLGKVFESLKAQLAALNYRVEIIRLSELISPYLTGRAENFASEYLRIQSLMEQGTKLRELTESRDIIGKLGIAKIRDVRKSITGEVNKAASRVAYVVSSFKRPEEVELYRQTYGKAFTLISVYSPRQARVDTLARKLRTGTSYRKANELAVQLIDRDYEEEGHKAGQRVGKTFPLADFFVTSDPRTDLDRHLARLIQLTFGNPYISPTKDEQGMFFAKAAALRSLDLSRQVGAAIIDDDGAIISSGCNEVPKAGGGLYWPDSKPGPHRDCELGYDANVTIKSEIIEQALDQLKQNGWLAQKPAKLPSKDRMQEALYGKNAFLQDSLIYDVIEFGRAVHAESAAITEAARRGVGTRGTKLFCTTFPCHICARHIVASGISEVQFVEPYEKSRTAELYADSVCIEQTEPSSEKVNFRAFVGVAPRRYLDFFELTAPRKLPNGKTLEWNEIAKHPRISRIVLTYLLVEELAMNQTPPPFQPTRRRRT